MQTLANHKLKLRKSKKKLRHQLDQVRLQLKAARSTALEEQTENIDHRHFGNIAMAIQDLREKL